MMQKVRKGKLEEIENGYVKKNKPTLVFPIVPNIIKSEVHYVMAEVYLHFCEKLEENIGN